MHRQDNTQQCGQSNCRLSHKECYHWKDIFAFLGISLNRCWGYFLMAYQLSPVQGTFSPHASEYGDNTPSRPRATDETQTLTPPDPLVSHLSQSGKVTGFSYFGPFLQRNLDFCLSCDPPPGPRTSRSQMHLLLGLQNGLWWVRHLPGPHLPPSTSLICNTTCLAHCDPEEQLPFPLPVKVLA